MDCDTSWEKEHMMLRLEDIVDLNEGERALMAVWNRYPTIQWLKAFIWLFSQIFSQKTIAFSRPSFLGNLFSQIFASTAFCRFIGEEFGGIWTS